MNVESAYERWSLPLGVYSVMTVFLWPRDPEPRPGPWWMPLLGWWLNNPLDLLWFIFFFPWNFLYILELNQSFSKICIRKKILLISDNLGSSQMHRVWRVMIGSKLSPQNVKVVRTLTWQRGCVNGRKAVAFDYDFEKPWPWKSFGELFQKFVSR